MNASIINTAITAGTSLITCLVGILSSKQGMNTSSVKTIREQQLKNVFLPLEYLFEFSDNTDVESLFTDISSIIKEQFLLVPSDLYAAFREIANSESPNSTNLQKFKEINVTFFNITKKMLGYPYDANVIHSIHASRYKRNNDFQQVISIALCLISLVLITASGVTEQNYIYALISTFLSVLTCLLFSLRLFLYKRIL